MTINTPFPVGPATPYWDPRGKWGGGMAGLGDAASDAATAAAIASIAGSANTAYLETLQYQPGTYSQTSPYGTTVYVQPVGSGALQLPSTVNTPIGQSSSSGFMVLLLIGAAFYFMSQGGR